MRTDRYSSADVMSLLMQEAQRRGLTWFTPQNAAGIAGNLHLETGGFDPSVIDMTRLGDNGKAHGLMQWHPDRYNNLVAYAAATGQPVDMNSQIQFIFEEASPDSQYADSGSVRAFRALQSALTPEDSSNAFIHAERPQGYNGDPNSAVTAQERARLATQAFTGDTSSAQAPMSSFRPPARPTSQLNPSQLSQFGLQSGVTYDNTMRDRPLQYPGIGPDELMTNSNAVALMPPNQRQNRFDAFGIADGSAFPRGN